MSWQTDIYSVLRDRNWHTVGVLFDLVEQDIPLHVAMRRYLGTRKDAKIPANTEARWLYFKFVLGLIGIELKDVKTLRGLRWNSEIRIGYVKDQQCKICGGPVIKKGWAVTKKPSYSCLACENPIPVEVDIEVFFDANKDYQYDIQPVYIHVFADKVVTLPFAVSISVPAVLPVPSVWHPVDFKMPRLKHKRKRKRRIKTYPPPRPTIVPVAPPVLVKSPKPIRPPRPVPKPRPILPPISNVQPVQKGEVVSVTVDQIWKEFLQDVAGRIPRFNDNPKLRRMLHRALEAGICDEYTQAMQGTFNELVTLGINVVVTDNGKRLTIINPVDLTHAGKVIATRGGAWINATCMEHIRRRWGNALIHAYSFGATGILVVLLQDRLQLMKKEIEHLIVANQPKIRPSNGSPPKPAKQRWIAPFRQARNVLNRYFNR